MPQLQVVASTSLALKFLVQGLEVEQDLEPGEEQALAMKNREIFGEIWDLGTIFREKQQFHLGCHVCQTHLHRFFMEFFMGATWVDSGWPRAQEWLWHLPKSDTSALNMTKFHVNKDAHIASHLTF